MIGIAREAKSITADPLPTFNMKRTRDYDCGPQAVAAAQLST
jgi:hypothetical protein